MKLGIYAGTFDPIHIGHLEFAKAAIREADLDKVVLAAEKTPYRKRPYAAWDHRQAMIERATESIDRVDHDYGFASQLSHQHTMKDMLDVATRQYGEDSEVWFLVGSDIFEHMNKWQSLLKCEEYGGFVVALRDDHTREWLEEKIEHLTDKFGQLNIRVFESKHPHVSSSKLRSQIKDNYLELAELPKSAAEYIFKHRLYK